MTRPDTHSAPSALLSESASRGARALVRWTPQELEAVARGVGEAVARAASRWCAADKTARFLEALTSSARAVHAEDAEAALQALPWATLGTGAQWAVDADAVGCLRDAFFGESPVAPGAQDGRRIADELAAECWAEQCAALEAWLDGAVARASKTAPGEASSAPWRRWSGAVLVQLPWFGATWHVVLGQPVVQAALNALGVRRGASAAAHRASITPVLRALERAPVRMEVRLAPIDLGLGSLVTLRVGDVLKLGHPVDAPARLVASGASIDAAAQCLGWLGQRDADVAVELVRAGVATAH